MVPIDEMEIVLQAWYLVTTKLKSEIRVKQNLETNHGLETFFPVFPARKASSAIGLPLFPRYVFVYCCLAEDFQKVQYAPGVSKIVCFGSDYQPVEEDVITCLRNRCNEMDVIVQPQLNEGEKVRVKAGIFEGCQGIIQEKRGNRRVQLLLEIAFGPAMKVELDSSEVEKMRQG